MNFNKTTITTQLNANKINSILNEGWLWQSRLAEVPFSIEAQPTDTCNFNCQYCSYKTRRRDSAFTFWDLETGMYFADFLCNEPISSLIISGGGEPLTWKFMPIFLKRLHHTPHLKKILITNGSLIGKQIELNLLQDFSIILISIASTEADIYQRTMRGDALNPNTLKNILNLPLLFAKPGPEINACVVVSRTNNLHLTQIATNLLNKGFDFVYFKTEYKFEPLGENLSEGQQKKIQEQIQEAKLKLPSFIIEKTNLINFIDNSNKKIMRNKPINDKCINLKYLLNFIINAKGDIYSCVSKIGNIKYSFGNIRESHSIKTLKNIKNLNKKILEINKEYNEGKCGRCRFLKYNDLLTDNKILENKIFIKNLYINKYFI